MGSKRGCSHLGRDVFDNICDVIPKEVGGVYCEIVGIGVASKVVLEVAAVCLDPPLQVPQHELRCYHGNNDYLDPRSIVQIPNTIKTNRPYSSFYCVIKLQTMT